MEIPSRFQLGDYLRFSLYCNDEAMSVAPIMYVTGVRFTEGKVRYNLATEDGLTLENVDSVCVYDLVPVLLEARPPVFTSPSC